MVVSGPNQRKDYHIEGDIALKIIEDGTSREIPIREGDSFLLPAGFRIRFRDIDRDVL